MPRSGGGVYSLPAGTTATSGTTISSVTYNAFLADLVSDLNAARPITAGGTGATSASAARTQLGLAIGTNVQAFGAVLDDLNTLGANSADSEFLVGTGAGALAWESGATARTSMGLGALAVEDTVGTSLIDDNAVSLAKQAGGTADRLQGFDGSGDPSEITVGTGLSLSGGALTVSSAWTLIDETVISSPVASHGVGSLSSYREIWIELSNVKPASANANILLRTDSGAADVGDSGVSDYSWMVERIHRGGQASSDDTADTAIILNGSDTVSQPTTSGVGVTGRITYHEFNQAVIGLANWDIYYESEAGANEYVLFNGVGARLSATARDFVQILFSTGNIASGVIRVYGK